jgi:hypothetical protein
MSESALSRALSGKVVPELRTVEVLFAAASADASKKGDEVGVTLDDLYQLHEKAASEQNNPIAARLSTDLESASRELRAVRDENAQLRSTYAELCAQHDFLRKQASLHTDSLRSVRRKYAALQRRAASLRERVSLLEAGSSAPSPGRQAAAPLPVPRREGDRQPTELDAAAARNVARRAEVLCGGGRQADEVLALVRNTADAYSPAETALLVVLLTQSGQDELAGDLLHIYGRDKPDREVLRAALELLKADAPAKAEALLVIAARTRRTNRPAQAAPPRSAS